MNRFDRVTSLLLLLQTRSVVTAQFLSDRFGVSERTIYRDIRTLETAGVPIGAEAGVGYYLEKGYRLPPVSFTRDETAALLLGEKLLVSSLDADSLRDFQQALNKVRAVLDRSDSEYLSALDTNLEVLPTGSPFPIGEMAVGTSRAQEELPVGDSWLRECRTSLVHRYVTSIDYQSVDSGSPVTRVIEPIGLFFYSWHWHLIAWCRLREAYRDFRLDRIKAFDMTSEQFSGRDRLTLQQYLVTRPEHESLQEVEVKFGPETARFVGEQRYMFGFVGEERQQDGTSMRFLNSMPEYMARWLLQFVDDVEVVHGDVIRELLQEYSRRLSMRWGAEPKPS